MTRVYYQKGKYMGGVIVAATWCTKRVKCTYCNERIDVATPILVKKVWSAKGRRQYRFPYHIVCWIKEVLDYMQEHPYEAAASPRKLDLTDEEREHRRKLLARRAAIRQRIRKWEEVGDAWADMKIKNLLAQEADIADKLAHLGGVPERWIKDLEDTP